MVLPLYLAMTAAEMGTNTVYPDFCGFMACHFSTYGSGLSNLPHFLPEGSMLILNDRIPWEGHDPKRITEQLRSAVETLNCESVLLDFQRPPVDGVVELIPRLTDALSCPVAVSHLYAGNVTNPVFLPPVPPDIPLKEHLAPWPDREIWLEAALDGCIITLTKQGSTISPLPYPASESGHKSEILHCHYTMKVFADRAIFTLFRTREDLAELLEDAQTLGITRAIGLWQEFAGT